MKTLVIIPAYNEEGKISDVINQIVNLKADLDIIVVNDGSQDKTSELARRRGIEVVTHPFNMGYGASLQTGYKYAMIKKYDYVVQIDADGQHDPNYIKTLLDVLEKNTCDIVIGSRFLNSQYFKSSVPRKIGIFLFRIVVSFLLKKKRITDPTSGFQALNRRAFEFCALEDFPADFPDTDVLIWLSLSGFRICEVPVKMYERTDGNPRCVKGFFHSLYYIFKVSLSIGVTLTQKVKNKKGV